MSNKYFNYTTKIQCAICDNKFIRTSGNQKNCKQCIESGKAYKKRISDYYKKNRKKILRSQKEIYYKDLKHTRSIKNKYANSKKGIKKKREYYKKNKDIIIERSQEWIKKNKPWKHRELAKKLMKDIDKKCVDCESVKDIQIHHIDGNFRNTVIKNLVYVCRRCHGLRHRKLNLRDDS